MRFSIFLVFILFPYLSLASECANMEGTWSTHNVLGSNIYREIITQQACKSIEIEVFHPLQASRASYIKILMNDSWECDNDTTNRLECYKGKWVSENSAHITRAAYIERCLHIQETILDYDGALVSTTDASCPKEFGGGGFGRSRLIRVTE